MLMKGDGLIAQESKLGGFPPEQVQSELVSFTGLETCGGPDTESVRTGFHVWGLLSSWMLCCNGEPVPQRSQSHIWPPVMGPTFSGHAHQPNRHQTKVL